MKGVKPPIAQLTEKVKVEEKKRTDFCLFKTPFSYGGSQKIGEPPQSGFGRGDKNVFNGR